jgi:ABC-type sugar transport system permease subunit
VYKGVRVSQLDFDVGNAAAVFIFVTALLIALVFIKVFVMNTSMED